MTGGDIDTALTGPAMPAEGTMIRPLRKALTFLALAILVAGCTGLWQAYSGG